MLFFGYVRVEMKRIVCYFSSDLRVLRALISLYFYCIGVCVREWRGPMALVWCCLYREGLGLHLVSQGRDLVHSIRI